MVRLRSSSAADVARLLLCALAGALVGINVTLAMTSSDSAGADTAPAVDVTVYSPEDVPEVGFDPLPNEMDVEETFLGVTVGADPALGDDLQDRGAAAVVHAQPLDDEDWRLFWAPSVSGRETSMGSDQRTDGVCERVRAHCFPVQNPDGTWSYPEGVEYPVSFDPDDEIVMRWVSDQAGATPPCEWLIAAGLWDGERVVGTTDVRVDTC